MQGRQTGHEPLFASCPSRGHRWTQRLHCPTGTLDSRFWGMGNDKPPLLASRFRQEAKLVLKSRALGGSFLNNGLSVVFFCLSGWGQGTMFVETSFRPLIGLRSSGLSVGWAVVSAWLWVVGGIGVHSALVFLPPWDDPERRMGARGGFAQFRTSWLFKRG